MNVKLVVDGQQIELNQFVVKILGGMIQGAIVSLREVKKDWEEIKIEVTRRH